MKKDNGFKNKSKDFWIFLKKPNSSMLKLNFKRKLKIWKLISLNIRAKIKLLL